MYTIYAYNDPATPTPSSSSFLYNPLYITAIFEYTDEHANNSYTHSYVLYVQSILLALCVVSLVHISIGGGREGGTGGGVVNTRGGDFEEVLAASLSAMGPPPSRAYCRTTLVKKPIRSKYCVYTGKQLSSIGHLSAHFISQLSYVYCIDTYPRNLHCSLRPLLHLFEDVHRPSQPSRVCLPLTCAFPRQCAGSLHCHLVSALLDMCP